MPAARRSCPPASLSAWPTRGRAGASRETRSLQPAEPVASDSVYARSYHSMPEVSPLAQRREHPSRVARVRSALEHDLARAHVDNAGSVEAERGKRVAPALCSEVRGRAPRVVPPAHEEMLRVSGEVDKEDGELDPIPLHCGVPTISQTHPRRGAERQEVPVGAIVFARRARIQAHSGRVKPDGFGAEAIEVLLRPGLRDPRFSPHRRRYGPRLRPVDRIDKHGVTSQAMPFPALTISLQ